MKSKILFIGALSAILLTGCGSKDVLLQQAKDMEPEFVSSIYEYKPVTGYGRTPQMAVSEEKCRQMKELRDALITFVDEDEAIEKEDNLFIASKWEKPEKILKEVQDSETGNLVEFYDFNIYMDSVERAEQFFRKMEELGYDNLLSLFQEETKEVKKKAAGDRAHDYYVVRQGVSFEVFMQMDKNEADENWNEYINIYVEVPEGMITCPVEYLPLINGTIWDGFLLTGINTGGYVERLTFQNGMGSRETAYNKKIDCYMKDGKLIQMEIAMAQNSHRKTSDVFAEKEQETMVNLLSYFTGDENASRAFVSGFDPDKEKSGTIGNYTWTITKKGGGLGVDKYYVIQVQ